MQCRGVCEGVCMSETDCVCGCAQCICTMCVRVSRSEYAGMRVMGVKVSLLCVRVYACVREGLGM